MVEVNLELFLLISLVVVALTYLVPDNARAKLADSVVGLFLRLFSRGKDNGKKE